MPTDPFITRLLRTPESSLHLHTILGDLDVVMLLTDIGCDLNIVILGEYTPLDLAIKYKQHAIKEFLLSKAAKKAEQVLKEAKEKARKVDASSESKTSDTAESAPMPSSIAAHTPPHSGHTAAQPPPKTYTTHTSAPGRA